jgi:hypothetical protein
VHSSGPFLDSYYTRQNAVVTEQKLDEIGARFTTLTSQVPDMICRIGAGCDKSSICCHMQLHRFRKLKVVIT